MCIHSVELTKVPSFPQHAVPRRTLKEFLFAQYGRPLDRSAPKQSLVVDDFSSSDQSHSFCHLSVELDDSEAFRLKIQNAPVSAPLREFVESRGWSIQETVYGPIIVIDLVVRESVVISELAKAVGRQVGRGRRYDNPNWKWVCPRTADSLKRLAQALWAFRSAKRHGQL